MKLKFVKQPTHPVGADLVFHHRGKKYWAARQMGGGTDLVDRVWIGDGWVIQVVGFE